MQNLLQTLQEIGLKPKEAEIYLSLLTIGCNPASTIAKKAKQNRSNCYTIIEKLMQKGFVHQIIKNNISYFCAVEPKNLLDQFKNKRYELEEKITHLTQSVEQLEQLKMPNQTKPKVIFYQGEAAIQNIMEETLSAKETIRAYASLDELTTLLPTYFPQYYKRRCQKGLFVKAIYPATPQSLEHKKHDHEELRESRLIPKEFDFHLDILIYDDKVAITSLKEKFGVVINSKDMAEAQKKIFDIIWNATKNYDETITKLIVNKEIKKAPIRPV